MAFVFLKQKQAINFNAILQVTQKYAIDFCILKEQKNKFKRQ